ncbi:hypothetical protein VC83_01939 [Pseudogymnoascus destructans]|uniref:SH3 domain-containing protein n=2 Tax=Pseudogymnoascus destructans TaxID=655981 RepID=L8FSP5_PSED2|nr:uncharacterized protein VC83_01939 [Pseudogymnoascus destructans]ELR03897.1 hypothetical protein GMDG_06431 [Pseudogymnoascus destructans 20631-21]OAF61464.1 hypothetical protein VC83_01939 [Pseudogymnoascus destructans]
MVHQHHRHLHGARDFRDFFDDLGNAVGLGNQATAAKREGSTRYVYVTQSPTFTDPIAGYSTSLPGGGDPTPTTPVLLDSPTPKPTPKSTAHTKASTTAQKPKTTPTPTSLSGLPESIVPSSTVNTNSVVLIASQTEATSETPTPTSSPSSTPSVIPSTAPSGMTGGAKAGLAIGIIVVIASILSLIFFCLRRRKKAEERERMDDEKFTNVPPPSAAAAAGGPASMRGLKRLSTAPRLDVRPTTAFFMPNRASQVQNPNAAGSGIQMTSQNRGMEQNRANPFGNHAESIDPVNAGGPSVVDGVSAAGVVAGAAPVRSTSRGAQNKYNGNKNAQSPFSDAARTDGNRATNTSQQMHNTGVMPQPLAGVIEESSSGPASPVSPAAAAAVVGAGGAASNANLYRVHLDFSPSMPDELKVRAGEIVKLLKEFDDGWCMCIKEDGSSEGVLPRTCISNSPIAARRSPSNKSNKPVPGPFQNDQRRHSPTGSNAPLYPSYQNQGPIQNQQQQQGPNQGMNQNRAGPPMNGNGRGPQYRPQQGPNGQGRPQQGRPQGPNQGGRPMSPAMSANGRNSPGPGNYGPGPQYRPQQGPGPMSPGMNRGPPQQSQQAQQQQQGPSSPPPHAISSPSSSAATVGSSSPVAAAVPLPSSPALSQEGSGFSIPEVTITAPTGPAAPAVVVERKPVGVGRKPVPGN